MFHWSYHYHDKKVKGSKDIAVGDWVQSRYRSPWYGIVLTLDKNTGCAEVRVVLSKRGAPIRKGGIKRYHVNWFRVCPSVP